MQNVIEKEWIGKRKIHIYLQWHSSSYKFCWIQLLLDGSFSFGFESKSLYFTEYGSSIVRSGIFVDPVQTLSGGNVKIKDVHDPHVTFHSPRINQKTGIVNFTGSNGRVDRFELDWFPVKSPQILLCTFSGDISGLEKINKPKGRYEIVSLPAIIQCVKMNLGILPIPKVAVKIHDINALTSIYGSCPNYILVCRFYKNKLEVPSFYIATDSYIL